MSWLQGHARSRKYLCSMPSRVTPARCDREISVKPLSMTGESCENRKPVEESSNGECRASLQRSTKANRCDFPTGGFFIPAEFSESDSSLLQKKENQAGE